MRNVLLAVTLVASLGGTAAAQVEAGEGDPARAAAQACAQAPFVLSAEQRSLMCTALTGPMEPQLRLTRIEEALNRIEGPSAANAALSGARLLALVELGRRADALRETRLAMQRYPQLPPLWFQATNMFAFTEYTADAADFWIELARFNPDMARTVSGYNWRAVRNRLSAQGKPDKVRALAAALEAIGYDGDSEADRSALAEELFDEAVALGSWTRARELLPRLSDRAKLAEIAAEARTRRLWDDMAWSRAEGRDAAVRRWLEGLGAAARDDGDLGARFIALAVAHIGPEPVLAAYEPVLRAAMQRSGARLDDFGLTFWLGPMATAHAASGDDAAAEALLRDAIAFFAPLNNPVRLNASANLAQFLQLRGRNAEALELIDAAIAELQRMGGVDMALLQMHGVRARALARLDREPEAWRSVELLRQSRASVPEVYLGTLLALGRYEEARDVLVEQLRSATQYKGAVLFLQPPITAFRPPLEVVEQDWVERLRRDPAVLHALEGKGRILELDPVRVGPMELPPLTPNPPRPLG